MLVGLILAAVMVALGVWQFQSYQSSGERSAAARAAAAPLDLAVVAPPGAAVRTGFGRSVRFQGRYAPSLQVLVPLPASSGTYRVLTGLRLPDGSIVPVVRGLVTTPTAPEPPVGPVTQTGVLLPSEDDAPSEPTSDGGLDAVRLPVLAQRWPGQLIGGFVTLSSADARAQALTAAPLQLPQGQGRLRNAAYAFQWWLFAVFTMAMAIRIARDLRRQEDLADFDQEGEWDEHAEDAHSNAT